MGFFKDLKDDASAAAGNDAADDLFAISDTEDDEFIEDVDAGYLDANSEEVVFEEEEDTIDEAAADETIADSDDEDDAEDNGLAETEEEKEAPREGDATQVTIITRGTTINGSIISDCSLDVMGTINGDIECLGKLSISGTVVGNSSASDVFVNTKRLEGNIDSEGSVKVGLGTVVIGDIKAGSGVIAGAVKGDVEISGPIVIDSTAIIKGNIKAKAVQMNNGAVVEGFCSLSNASVDIDDIFE